jgi:hypothetical protein
MNALKSELAIRGLKMADLGYIGAGHFMAGFFLSRTMDNLLGTFDKEAEKKKSTLRVTLEVILLLWVNAVVLYVAKNLMELVPSPLDGIAGFQHARVKEVRSAPLLAFALLYYQTDLQDKLKGMYNRFATNPK